LSLCQVGPKSLSVPLFPPLFRNNALFQVSFLSLFSQFAFTEAFIKDEAGTFDKHLSDSAAFLMEFSSLIFEIATPLVKFVGKIA